MRSFPLILSVDLNWLRILECRIIIISFFCIQEEEKEWVVVGRLDRFSNGTNLFIQFESLMKAILSNSKFLSQ